MTLHLLSRQVLVSPGMRECNIRMSVSGTPASHGVEGSMDESWDQVPRANKGGQGNGSEEEQGEGCK
jgi:hypothetical protein